jgi:hypothetical protein
MLFGFLIFEQGRKYGFYGKIRLHPQPSAVQVQPSDEDRDDYFSHHTDLPS